MKRKAAATAKQAQATTKLLLEASNAIENLAQIALSGFDADAMHHRFQGWQPGQAECIGDAMRLRLIAAAVELTQVEVENAEVWERHDWRDTCDRIAARLNEGHEVTKAWIETEGLT